ncbi:MAG: lipid kinase [Bacteroidaceae bacterium]|nr:lipid kinase [Bacteroidaceae bacterium]MDE6721331.1 lipid kinase [Bacteroidaceae bacterium]MDE7118097.1 lipid kinase [Bacteroidaceae bacterium]
MAETNRIGVIYSPHSGWDHSQKRWQLIRQYMESKGVLYDFVQSEASGSVERLTKMMCDNGYRTIAVVGGDGALNCAVNAMMQSRDTLPEDFAFAVIPNGIGNDFSRFWGVSTDDYKRVVDGIIARNLRKVDVGCCTYQDDQIPQRRYFLNCINIGLGARLIKTTYDAAYIIGSRRLSIIPALINRVFERKQFAMSMKIETEEIEGKYMSMCIGNCLGYGQTPNSVPYNGMLDISLITRPKWWQLFEGFWLLGKGRFLNYKNVHPYRARQIVVNDVDKALVSLDGIVLPSKEPAPMRITIERDVLNFVVPLI